MQLPGDTEKLSKLKQSTNDTNEELSVKSEGTAFEDSLESVAAEGGALLKDLDHASTVLKPSVSNDSPVEGRVVGKDGKTLPQHKISTQEATLALAKAGDRGDAELVFDANGNLIQVVDLDGESAATDPDVVVGKIGTGTNEGKGDELTAEGELSDSVSGTDQALMAGVSGVSHVVGRENIKSEQKNTAGSDVGATVTVAGNPLQPSALTQGASQTTTDDVQGIQHQGGGTLTQAVLTEPGKAELFVKGELSNLHTASKVSADQQPVSLAQTLQWGAVTNTASDTASGALQTANLQNASPLSQANLLTSMATQAPTLTPEQLRSIMAAGGNAKTVEGALQALSGSDTDKAALKAGSELGQAGLPQYSAQLSSPLMQAKGETANTQPPLVLHKDPEMASNQLADRVNVMLSKNLKQVDIRLDPPELGRIHIKMGINNDQATVQFTVSSHHVRDLVEHAMPRLREMLNQQGLQLAQSSVDQQDAGRQAQQQFQNQSQQQGQMASQHQGSGSSGSEAGRGNGIADAVSDELPAGSNWYASTSRDRVDYYA